MTRQEAEIRKDERARIVALIRRKISIMSQESMRMSNTEMALASTMIAVVSAIADRIEQEP